MTIREKQIIQKGIAAQSEELLRTLLSVVQDGICFLSPEHDILYQNPAMRFWYGSEDRKDAGKCYALYHGRSAPCESCPMQKAKQSGKTEEKEVLFENTGRMAGWKRVFCSPVYGTNGEIELFVEYVRDMTEERKAALSAELVEAQNRELLDMLNQQEEEHLRLEKKRTESMNQSFASILRYLRATLDSHSYSLIERQMNLLKSAMKGAAPEEKLSGQELTIARYIADGYMSKEIADLMNLSKKTVDYHRSNIRRKLELAGEENLRQAILDYFSKTGISRLE